MATTSDIRNGMTINHNHGIWTIIEFLHVKPGKGNAFVRTKIRNLKSLKVVDHTFPAGHYIDEVRVERQKYQYLYKDGNTYNFMNNETFEQYSLEKESIPSVEFLMEGMMCELLFNVNSPEPEILSVAIPSTVEMEVTYTEPGLKGDTATNTLKPATVASGAEIRVPLFIVTGDVVKINTESWDYMERVKK